MSQNDVAPALRREPDGTWMYRFACGHWGEISNRTANMLLETEPAFLEGDVCEPCAMEIIARM